MNRSAHPWCAQLIEIVQNQTEIIQVLRDDIAVLKGNKPKPPLEKLRSGVRVFADLKTYRESPCEEKKIELSQRFDEIFTQKTDYITLNLTLAR